jgi:DNA modification methylase
MSVTLLLGDCTKLMADIPSASVDGLITDPPYPEISRDYGRMTEAAWWDMMMVVCAETRRILKPTGSAVFILQPNSRKVGSMRGWLWEFMAWVCREWNMVQDVWWWNIAALPVGGATNGDLTRASIKACVWAGSDNCYRYQERILLPEADRTQNRNSSREKRLGGENILRTASGQTVRVSKIGDAAIRRGGVTPYNCLPVGTNSINGNSGHGAGTPLELAKWWTRYIVPPGGVVCDPFMGSGTMGLAALAYGCDFIGMEKEDRPGYYPTATARLADAQEQPRLEAVPA